MLCYVKKKKKVVGLFRRSGNKSGTITIRRSGMLRSYKIGSRLFDTFTEVHFFCLARSCRIVEKFDKNHRFFMIFCDRVPRSDRSYRISPQRGTISANGEKWFRAMYLTLCLRVHSVWVHRSVELCCHNDRILLKNSIIWLSGANIEAIEI